MKIIYFVVALFGFFIPSKGICQVISSNIVITIDDRVVGSSLGNPYLLLSGEKGINKIEVHYIPGELFYNKADLEKVGKLPDTATLVFGFTEYCNNKRLDYSYEIEFRPGWLKQSYTVIHIYNLNKKKYRKEFYPRRGHNYTYDFDTPNGYISVIRRKTPKNECY